jgi:ATP-binding cassette subfamily B protein
VSDAHPQQKKKQMLASLWRLRGFVKPYRARLGMGIFAFGISRILEAMVPFLMGVSINRMIAGNFDVTGPVSGIIAAVLARYVAITFARYSVRKTGMNVAFDLRQQLYAALQYQGSDFFNHYSIGDMMTRAVADIALIQRLFSGGSILLIILIYSTIVGFSFMIYYSPILTLLLLPPMPFIFVYARYASRAMGVTSQDVQDRLSDLGTQVQENLSGIRTIQAMVQEDNEIKRFSATNQAYADAFYEQGRITSAMAAIMPSFAAICSLTILGYGGYQVIEGTLPVGHFVAFFMFVNMVVQPFRVAGTIINLFQRAAVASNRLFEVFDLRPEIPDQPAASVPREIVGRIEVRNLSFRYPEAQNDALSNVSFEVGQGETIAIMGRVGSGKTTLLKQLVRLLDPAPDTVFIDGQEVRTFALSQLRSQVAMVPQDPFLFGEPLKDNLTYDDPNRALDEIWNAASSADLRDTIDEFPEKLDTLVGERGVTLSGGQKQRATLARGLIRHAPVLILDDCFSAVDTETEEHILSELKRLRRTQSTLIVSHRVSTARHADRIIIIDEGKIIEEGTHKQLLELKGYYAELERVQREGAEDEDLSRIRSGS